eukprot:6206814-Pleurochrysis_carterae.AAC.4
MCKCNGMRVQFKFTLGRALRARALVHAARMRIERVASERAGRAAASEWLSAYTCRHVEHNGRQLPVSRFGPQELRCAFKMHKDHGGIKSPLLNTREN